MAEARGGGGEAQEPIGARPERREDVAVIREGKSDRDRRRGLVVAADGDHRSRGLEIYPLEDRAARLVAVDPPVPEMVRASETLRHGRSDPRIHRPFAQRWQRAHGDRTPHVRLQAEVEVASPRVPHGQGPGSRFVREQVLVNRSGSHRDHGRDHADARGRHLRRGLIRIVARDDDPRRDRPGNGGCEPERDVAARAWGQREARGSQHGDGGPIRGNLTHVEHVGAHVVHGERLRERHAREDVPEVDRGGAEVDVRYTRHVQGGRYEDVPLVGVVAEHGHIPGVVASEDTQRMDSHVEIERRPGRHGARGGSHIHHA